MRIFTMVMMFAMVVMADWSSTDSQNLSSIQASSAGSQTYLQSIDSMTENNNDVLSSIKTHFLSFTQYYYNHAPWSSSEVQSVVTGQNVYNDYPNKPVSFDSTFASSLEDLLPVNMVEANSTQLVVGGLKDRTADYIGYVMNPWTIRLGINAIESFMDDWRNADFGNSLESYNNPTNGANEGAITNTQLKNTNHEDINKLNQIGVRMKQNVFDLYQPDNDVLFTIDFSSLGHAFSRLTGGGNRWTDFNLEFSLNPTEDRKCLYKLHQMWDNVMFNKNVFALVEFAVIAWSILIWWNVFKSVLQMD